MPRWGRAVDSISPAVDKHDLAGGKVDRLNLSAGHRHPHPTILILQGSREFRPLRPPESVTIQEVGDDHRTERLKLTRRICKVTKMLDNSGREKLEKRHRFATDPRAQEARVLGRGSVCVWEVVAIDVSDHVGTPSTNEGPNEAIGSRRKNRETERARSSKQTHQHRLGAIAGGVTVPDEAPVARR